MLTIRTHADISGMRESRTLPEPLLEEIERYFKALCESFSGEPDGWKTYDLTHDGPIHILQPGIDDPEDIRAYGMNRDNGGIFCAPIEYVQALDLGCVRWYKIMVMLDNDFMIAIFSEAGKFGPELDQHLEEHLEPGGW